MRRISHRLSPSLGLALGLALIAALPARGQAPSPGADANSLARFVPKDDTVLYLEFDGLDAHDAAWQRTAAYKILNATSAGGMIRDVLTQLLDKLKVPGGGRNLALVEHALRAGFVVAAGGKMETDQPFHIVVVIRKAFSNRDVRPALAYALSSLDAPETKAKAVVRQGHKVMSGTLDPGMARALPTGNTYSWWVEETKKEDVVLVFPTLEATDLILDTLDGKTPNAIDHPLRAGLMTPENGFEPVAAAFINPKSTGFKKNPQLGLDEATRIDVRWGFQDDALQTVFRVATPSPRRGMLGFAEGATFNKASLPPLPDNVTGFTVASVDTKAAFDQVLAAAGSASPDAAGRINAALDSIQGKGKLKLRDDILGRLGPKMAFYALPVRASDPPAPPPLGAVLGMMGMTQVPRGVAIFEVDDPVAFGRSLDELMIIVNREIKAAAVPPKPPEPPAAGAEAPRGRALAIPSPEFRLSPGSPKTYIFAVPPELSKTFPPSLRPSIRVGDKHVVIAMSSEAARDALEPKTTWTPPADLAAAFGSMSAKLKFLQVGDDRAGIATTLASLPAKVQILANSPIFRPKPAGAPAAPGTAPGAPTGDAPAIPPAEAEATPPGASGAPGSTPPAAPAAIVIQVAPGKLPSADTVKGMLFPSITRVEVESDEVRLISRVAFPDISGLSYAPAAAVLANPAARGGALPGFVPGGPQPDPNVPAPGTGGVSPRGRASDR
ncbi:hypothetical protein TA3x_001415 [Tundrisphaera sp. TA3]|uniref:hypothetical protein n=1 Tax=Tundrisphaera sp. TA3 TaxID=3435775 RepID=UPI003EC1148F